ncbi:MAG: membrane-binding protein [Cyclobacteriaceae bacterium]|nr:membrane-binding protein [Cyclobacteriaceae bacterium]
MQGITYFALGQGAIKYSYYDENSTQIKEKYTVRDSITNILEGEYKSYFLSGRLESRGEFLNNEATGSWDFFYETGNQKMRLVVRGQDEGYWQYFYESGEKSMEGLIVNDKRQGNWRLYYESGALKSEGEFKDGNLEGIWQFYYEDGKLKGEIDYTANKGRYIEYFATGEVKAEGPKSGFKNAGKWTFYYKEILPGARTKIQATGNYLNGNKVGDWTYFHPNQKVSSKGRYDSNRPEGEWLHYYDNGSISSKGEFVEGQKNGSWNLFYPDGKLKGEGEFIKGSGKYKEYYKNKNIRIEGQLVEGKNQGKWKYYYGDGTLEGTCDFNEGRGMYYGYYPDGTLQSKGIIQDDKKSGTWELYENDGSLSGFYKPYYEDSSFPSNLVEKKEVEPQGRGTGLPDYRFRSKGFKYFDSRINEFQGVILGGNPLFVFTGKIPFVMEFYIQERLGHEFEFEGIRKPFFDREANIPLDQVYSRGYSIAVRQKFYNPHNKLGMWYFGHELRFVNRGHFANIQLPIVPDYVKVTATEQMIAYSVIGGYRIMESTVSKGFTIDAFGGAGIGYRNFHADDEYADIFSGLAQNKIPLQLRFGLNFGYTLSFGRWK